MTPNDHATETEENRRLTAAEQLLATTACLGLGAVGLTAATAWHGTTAWIGAAVISGIVTRGKPAGGPTRTLIHGVAGIATTTLFMGLTMLTGVRPDLRYLIAAMTLAASGDALIEVWRSRTTGTTTAQGPPRSGDPR